MRDAADELIDLAAAIADGAPIDWSTVQSTSASDADRAMLRQLRAIAEIVSWQQRLASRPAHASVVDELRDESPPAADARDGLPSWGPLRLIAPAGEGAFGDVYRAWDARLDREVALKLLRRRPSRRASGFVEEGRLLARVRHPNVVTVYGADRIGDHVGIWMEYVEGPTLAQLVAADGPFAPEEVTRIGRVLCGALAAVHRAGLLHRDIKAQNVMRDRDGRVVLMDFGAGRDELDAASPRGIAGTPLYLAPEIFDGADASVRSDIYSLGALLYHLATGGYPIDGSTLAAIRGAHRRNARRPLAEARPDLPAPLAAVVDRALTADPAARFDSAASMETALAALEQQAQAPPRRLRYPGVASMVASAAAITVAAIAVQRAVAPRQSSGMVIRRIAANAQVTGVTGLSSDGRYVSDVDWEKSGNLVVRELATGRRRILTGKRSWYDSDESAEFSTFSPDDRRIAYVWMTRSSEYELRIVETDGSSPPRVVYYDPHTSYIQGAEWSPDGGRLLVVAKRTDGTTQMALLSSAGGQPRVLKTFTGGGPGRVAFSPDGRYVAYDMPQTEGAAERDIFALAVDGRGDVPLVQHPAHDFLLGWAPDGGRLVFGSDRSGTVGGWILPIADGKPAGAPELFRPDLGSGHPIRITPAGSYYYGVPVSTTDVYTATLDAAGTGIATTPVQAGQRFAGTNKWPEWSPDGSRLAYVSQFRTSQGDTRPLILSIETLDGGPVRELSPALGFFSRPRWSPDGRSMLSNARDRSDHGGLFRIDAETGDATLLVPSKGLPRQAAWTRDGRGIVYFDPNAGPIVRRDLATGAEQIVHAGGDFALSPDNRWIVVSEVDRGSSSTVLNLVALDRGRSRELARGAGTCAWMPDSRRVLCLETPDGRAPELWRFSIDETESPRLVAAMAGLNEVRINPDGRRIALSIARGSEELWVMENFLPPASVPRSF